MKVEDFEFEYVSDIKPPGMQTALSSFIRRVVTKTFGKYPSTAMAQGHFVNLGSQRKFKSAASTSSRQTAKFGTLGSALISLRASIMAMGTSRQKTASKAVKKRIAVST